MIYPMLYSVGSDRLTVMDEEKLNKLAQEVAKLRGEVWELAALQHALEARLSSLSEMIEARDQH